MKHPILFVCTVLTCIAGYVFGVDGLLLALASVAVGGVLALVITLCLIGAGANRDAARVTDAEIHEGEVGL